MSHESSTAGRYAGAVDATTGKAGQLDPEAMHPTQDLVDYAKAYARAKPEVAALWCFGVGFILGWKLKPW